MENRQQFFLTREEIEAQLMTLAKMSGVLEATIQHNPSGSTAKELLDEVKERQEFIKYTVLGWTKR